MKRWVIAATIDPSKLEGVISGRFGSSVMFVAYSKLLRQWYWVYGGGEEKIDEPEMLFLENDWVVTNRLLTSRGQREQPHRIRRKKVEQMQLFV